jgi:hypothetical protein
VRDFEALKAVDAARVLIAVRRRRKFNMVVYSELKVNIVDWPEAKVIIGVRLEAEIFEPGWQRVICVPLALNSTAQ